MKFRRLSVSMMAMMLAASINVNAANSSLPVVEIYGVKYYVYVAKKGDSLFGIARTNNWDNSELQRINPSAVSPLKKGVKLYYPVNNEDVYNSPSNLDSAPKTELIHVVKRGETVYSISKLYNIPVEQIYTLNPKSKNGIKADESLVLSYSIAETESVDEEKESQFYTVKKGDTMYAVSRENGITIAALMKANPGISEDNFQAGSTIKVPSRGTGLDVVTKSVEEKKIESFDLHEVKGNQTWTEIAEGNGVDVQLLKEANPGVDKLKKKQILAIPQVETYTVVKNVAEVDAREFSVEGRQEIYDEVHKVADTPIAEVVKIAIVSESPTEKKDVEFIRGFLTGVNELKSKPYKIELKVLDSTKGAEDVILKLDEYKPTMVFLTYDKNIPSFLSEYASISETPVVNTFDVKNEEYRNNPYFIQMLTPSNEFNSSVAQNVYEKYGDYKLIISGKEDASDLLLSELKDEWTSSDVKNADVEVLPDLKWSDTGKYIFYLSSTSKEDIQKLLKAVSDIKEINPLAKYVVLGRPNWIVYDEILAEEFHRVNTVIPSRFYLDSKSVNARHFYSSYKNLFDRVPSKSLPLFAGVGYDSATYFIPALASVANDVNELAPSVGTLQSEFALQRVSNWVGFVNPPVYLVNFTTYGTIDKIVID